MTMRVHGIHHVTAIAGDPQANVDFYSGVLGLRLMKVTVNYDDPHTYDLYFGDERGQPGTILTFFPWPGAPRGHTGTGRVTVTAFAIPGGSFGFWVDRLKGHKIDYTGPSRRFDEEVIGLQDPDGLPLELVTGASESEKIPRPDGTIPGKHAIQRFRGVKLAVEGYERTAGLLTATMGLREMGAMGNRFRYAVGEGDAQGFVDLLCLPSGPRGRGAGGTVHHIAWRTPDAEAQRAWRREIARLGYKVTPNIDRTYFHSMRADSSPLAQASSAPAGRCWRTACPGTSGDSPRESSTWRTWRCGRMSWPTSSRSLAGSTAWPLIASSPSASPTGRT
ncbi:MAG TPA: VOC family protein [Candidatus Methylomirabilis sp.]|nr:VOC family protein [Candidatus Methylomirabilis sp.]